MDMNTNTPLDQAKAILGEHFKNYVIIVQPEEAPDTFDLSFSCPWATSALLSQANKHQTTYLEGGTILDESDWVWTEEEEEEDEWD